MISNPKNLTEQLLNLAERVATEFREVYAQKADKSDLLTFDEIYPIGSVFQTKDQSFDPAKKFGGKWESSTSGDVKVWSRLS